MRAESLQRRPPCSFEACIAARTITRVAQKKFVQAPGDDPRAPPSGVTAHVQTVATVLVGERFVPAVSGDRFQTAATAAGFSIATTASPSPDIPGCSSAPSDALVEISLRIPSTNTLDSAVVVIAARSLVPCREVAFSDQLKDLEWGSWEACSRKAQVSEGMALLSEAPLPNFGDFKNSMQRELYQFCGVLNPIP